MLRMALATSFIGLICMFFMAQKIDFSKESLITDDDMEKTVSVKAFVNDVSSSNGFTRISASACQDITIIVFSNISISKESLIEAKGKIEEKDGKSEMIADEIIALN